MVYKMLQATVIHFLHLLQKGMVHKLERERAVLNKRQLVGHLAEMYGKWSTADSHLLYCQTWVTLQDNA